MRYGAAMVTVIAWSLWFGGMAALVLFVGYLFSTDRRIAAIAAPKMFAVFETYQLVVAAVALVAAAVWRLMSPGRAAVTFIFAMLAVAAVGLVVSALAVRGPMEKLRLRGESSSPAFQRLHKVSERLHGAQMLALLAAGVAIPVALGAARQRRQEQQVDAPRTETEAALPSAPPGEPADQAV